MSPAATARSAPRRRGRGEPRRRPARSPPPRRRSQRAGRRARGSGRRRPSRSTTSSVDAPLSRSWRTVAPPSSAARAVSTSSTSAWRITLGRAPPLACVDRGRIERREGVVEAGVEAAWTFASRAASSPATPKATSASAAAASGASGRTARKQPVTVVDMQPVPVIRETARGRSRSRACGPRRRRGRRLRSPTRRPRASAPPRASSAGSPPASIDSTPRTSASAPTSVAISPGFPRRTATSVASRIRRAVSVR